MLIPYRVKNPTKRFPIATVSLIAINVIVYLLTIGDYLQIREDVVNNYAFALGVSPLWRSITAMFLHGDPFHLLGNMLFFWVFGPPVEDRLGIPKFLALYFATGFAGDFLQAAIDMAVVGHVRPGIGASGCIMGVLGAYWYLFSWSTVCVFYWIYWFWHGVWEVQALWIIGLYFLLDLGEGILFGTTKMSGGVANFAHVGGSFCGALLCFILRIKRDTEVVSEAKAIQAETKDLSLVPLYALQSMLEDDPRDPNLLRAIVAPAMREGNSAAVDKAFSLAGPELIEIDAGLVAYYLLDVRGSGDFYNPVQLLRLAGTLERSGDSLRAMGIYRLIVERFATAPETETALYRTAQCSWNTHHDAQTALACLSDMMQRFPMGAMTPYGRRLRQQIEQAGASAGPGPLH